MYFTISRLLCLLTVTSLALAYPSPEENANCIVRRGGVKTTSTPTTSKKGTPAVSTSSTTKSTTAKINTTASTTKSVTTTQSTTKSVTTTQSTTKSATTTKSMTTSSAKGNIASSFISAICTSPGANFPAAALSGASKFCTEFLYSKTSTVSVTVTSPGSGASTVTVSTFSGGETRVTTIVTIAPSTTVTIPNTVTDPGTTETQTAPARTVTTVATISVTATAKTTVTTFTSTFTVTQTTFIPNRKRQNRGILGNYVDSVVSSACKCLAKSAPTKTVTITTATNQVQTITVPISGTNTITVTSTTELEEFTKSIFTVITLPGEEETTTVTPPDSTVTSTTFTTVTTTNTVSTVTTVTTRANTQPTGVYRKEYESNTCCYDGYSQTNQYSVTKDRAALIADCQARCDARGSTCYSAVLTGSTFQGISDYYCLLGYNAYSANLIRDPCQYSTGCVIYVKT